MVRKILKQWIHQNLSNKKKPDGGGGIRSLTAEKAWRAYQASGGVKADGGVGGEAGGEAGGGADGGAVEALIPYNIY
uniref:Uncharacterized protein n=1 Tax=Brassica oleracea var. oleracea TaxID=109376 RepID=A0A0D3E3S3_BRAOL